MDRRRLEEALFKVLMMASTVLVLASLAGVMGVVLVRGLPALDLAMITQTPKGGYYLGKEGGVLNAIAGSLCLAVGATAIALVLSLPIVFYLQRDYAGRSRLASYTRLALDVLWGIPSIVYGAFGFVIMLYMGLRASLLGGVIALTLVELPIMARAMDEVVRLVPAELKDASYALGATRIETTTRVVWRQVLPGIVTAALLAFGRGIGDAASVLFTAGYSDYLPSSLMEPVASLPLAVFFQILTPFPEVQQRAYASGAILLALVLIVSVASRLLARRFERHVVR
ncbi:MAG: phosphate ABC transporter permease PstA [Armatimonadota bacterium]|nr:MAG: phosphate ABC transporter permease PstA [Armatimonadota bacterium]